MLQRIQSLFLVLAACCAFGLLGVPFASSAKPMAASALFEDGLYSVYDHPAIFGLFVAAGALALIAIFRFKNRNQQLKLGRFAIIANLIGLVLALILFFNDQSAMQGTDVRDEFGLYLPLVFVLCAILALRYISKDERLVRSMDRLR